VTAPPEAHPSAVVEPEADLHDAPDRSSPRSRPLLELDRLSVSFGPSGPGKGPGKDQREDRVQEVVSQVSLRIGAGETVCLVGESGSGKTLTALSMLRLVRDRGAEITGGEVRLDGRDLVTLTPAEISALRGRRIAMVFQEPMTALDPLFTIGDQITEVIRRHRRVSRGQARREALALLERVHIPDAEAQLRQYPHQLSGGMRQRAMIAMALSCGPDLLVADEPTTALDVTIQAQILLLLKELQRDTGMSVVLITHDLGIAAEIADCIVVMYAGRVVEEAPVHALFARPLHPYTRGLLQSVVPLDSQRASRLATIHGSSPSAGEFPSGCRFHPRCPQATARCAAEEPVLAPAAASPPPDASPSSPASSTSGSPDLDGHDQRKVACWHPDVPSAVVVHPSPVSSAPSRAAEVAVAPETPLIETIRLVKQFRLPGRWLGARRRVRPVDDVSLQIQVGETFGLVGESGCGKSTLGRLLLQLETPTSGGIRFDGRDLGPKLTRDLGRDPGPELGEDPGRGPAGGGARRARQHRRSVQREMQMVFQDPHGSIDPLWSAGEIIGEPLRAHTKLGASARRARVLELMEQVGLDPAWYPRAPHAFSGGQRQRIGIARAIALHPRFIVADEAVSALDVSVQSQIVNLLQELKERLQLTYLFIGHGLNIIRHLSDHVGVMYLGQLVEVGPVDEVFQRPAHHYTRALLAAIPVADPRRRQAFVPLPGEIPSLADPPAGCRFHTRCPAATALCHTIPPELVQIGPKHRVSCHFPA
jgi:peptide/nickel transport system ATP-binding protein